MVEAKATARHDKLAKSKQQKLESLEGRLASEKAALGKLKADRKAEIKALPKEEQAAAKQKLQKELEDMKRKIASTKGGSLYTRPELVVLEESPEPDGMPLRPVDVEEMCRRNADLMETLVQETI